MFTKINLLKPAPAKITGYDRLTTDSRPTLDGHSVKTNIRHPSSGPGGTLRIIDGKVRQGNTGKDSHRQLLSPVYAQSGPGPLYSPSSSGSAKHNTKNFMCSR